MQVAQQLQDRRGTSLHHDEHWNSMSAEQKMALYNLHRFGYRLLFVRHLPSGPLAIIAQQNQLSSIDSHGNVNHNPRIRLRDQ
ncbi:hypothetical protein TUM4644_07850 [Shewanella colwelliana]|uniref:Uncharacterized protein n=1 Tax=Shewanella colwelliana TaxID=23 RepID=A0A1E5IS37_SHECO|nr:hypothetical protein [Shewanella colwelliana]MDX1280113.1 hypothetical protein [Shewanella colwelliana]OEG73371.1 hypothetical protein BEL05_13985 [Shewanella colwelliana]GIU19722.1 hypothetical protein TUM4644_07850 [Shewanella colwelliana]